jgi:hypothetical protein
MRQLAIARATRNGGRTRVKPVAFPNEDGRSNFFLDRLPARDDALLVREGALLVTTD